MFRLRNLVVFISFLLQILGTTPFLVQKVVIRLTQPIMLAGFAIMVLSIFQSTTNIIIFSVAVSSALAWYGRKVYLKERNAATTKSNIMPMDDSVDEATDEEHKSESADTHTVSNMSTSSKITPLLDSEINLSSEGDEYEVEYEVEDGVI